MCGDWSDIGKGEAVQLAFSSKFLFMYLHINSSTLQPIDGRDYGNNTGSLVLTFNATHNSSIACIPLIKDDIFELTEVLEVTLRLLGQPSSSLVSLVSISVNITILDDDGKSKTITCSLDLPACRISETVSSLVLKLGLHIVVGSSRLDNHSQ